MAEPLLFLPGMMCDARLYEPQIAAFSHQRPVMVAPLSGHDSMQGLAAEILSNAPPKFALAGLSMGGIVAMEVIRQAPERISHLALLDTNPRAELPEVAARRAPQIEAVKAGNLRTVMGDQMMSNYLTEGPNVDAILDICMAMAEDVGPETFVTQSLALRDRPDQLDTLCGVTVPTLILCGRDDRLCPLERHDLMHDLIPDATLSVIDRAGHLPTLENPDDTNKALFEWLTR